jgi:hypothetical protein
VDAGNHPLPLFRTHLRQLFFGGIEEIRRETIKLRLMRRIYLLLSWRRCRHCASHCLPKS